MVRNKFDLNLLTELCRISNYLLDDLTYDISKSNNNLNKNTIIKGKCINTDCNNNFERTFRGIKEKGFICKDCAVEEGRKKLKLEKIKEIEKILNDLKTEFEYKENLFYDRELLTTKSFIKGKCIKQGCNNNFEKNIVQIKKNSGFYCRTCAITEGKKKYINTINTLYGEEFYNERKNEVLTNVFQLQNIKEKSKQTCMIKYKVPYSLQNKEVREKGKKTIYNRHGVYFISQSKEFREKVKNTCNERYGGNSPANSLIVLEKMKNTCLEKYNVENPFQAKVLKEKIIMNAIKTRLDKYDVEYIFQSKIFREKAIKTCLKRYDVKYPMQNPDIANKCFKNSRRYKNYTCPSGNIREVQGYENFALDYLFNKDFNEEDIITDIKEIPNFEYICPYDKKNHKYFPDIFIKSENKIIEVKSIWTYDVDVPRIESKQQSVKDSGYECEIWIMNDKGEFIEILN
jgi:hypothetical protein